MPRWSGDTLDLVVDFTTYVFVPAYAIAASGLLPHVLAIPAGIVVVITGALYFADREMKTDDNYFRGFPAVWNLAAFYLYLLEPPEWAAAVAIAVLAGAELRADQVSSSAARAALAHVQHRAVGGVGGAGLRRDGSGSLAGPLCNAAAVAHRGLFFRCRIVAPTRLIVFDRRRKLRSKPCPDQFCSSPAAAAVLAPPPRNLQARAGYDVAVNYKTNSNAAAAVVEAVKKAGGKAIAMQGDMALEKRYRAGVRRPPQMRLGSITHFVHSSGIIGDNSRLDEASSATIREVLDVDTLRRAAVPARLRRAHVDQARRQGWRRS